MVRALLAFVLALPAATVANESPRAIVEFDVKPTEVHVGEQVLVTVRLLGNGSLLTSTLSDPASDGAVLHPLAEVVAGREMRDGTSYDVLERRYALFPVRPGLLRIAAPTFTGAYALGRGPATPFGDAFPTGPIRELTVSAPARMLSVLPVPHGVNEWVPSSRVDLTEAIDPPDGPYRVGKPFRRRIELRVHGQMHARLPVPALEHPDGLRVFPDAPVATTQEADDGVVAHWSRQWVLVPEAAGPLVLPELRLHWWDTIEKRSRIAVIGPRTVQVVAAGVGHGEVGQARGTPDEDSGFPPLPVVILALSGWLIAAGLWWRTRRATPPQPAPTPAPSASVASLLLRRSLRKRDAAATRRALIEWARAIFADPRIVRLDRVADAAGSETLRRELQALDRVIYGQDRSWNPEALAAALSEVVPASSAKDCSALPPLYPDEMEAIDESRPARRSLGRRAAIAVPLVILVLLVGLGSAFLLKDPGVATTPEAYRAMVRNQEQIVLEFLRAFERVQDDVHPQRVPQQQRTLEATFDQRVTAMVQELEDVRPPDALHAFNIRWRRIVGRLAEAQRQFVSASPQKFVAAFFVARRAFVDATLELYDLRQSLPIASAYWEAPDAAAAEPLQPSGNMPTGIQHFPTSERHGGFSLYVPESYDERRPQPLVVALHGSHGSARGALTAWLRPARSKGWIVLAPQSLGKTWELDAPDRDVQSIMAALEEVHARYIVDPKRVFLSGLSDGATFSYILSMGCPGWFAGIAPISGVLPSLAANDGARQLPVLITHGADDWLFPIAHAHAAYDALVSSGFSKVTLVPVPGWGHGLNYAVVEKYVAPWMVQQASLATAPTGCARRPPSRQPTSSAG